MARRVFLLTLLLAALPWGVQAQEQLPTYVVQPGDTLSGIAATFGTTVLALAELNQIENPSQLFPGQELKIPGFEGVEGVLTTREISYGDRLQRLARALRVSSDQLVQLNRIVNPARLYAGQELIYAEGLSPGADESGHEAVASSGFDPLSVGALLGRNPWELAGADLRRWLLPGEAIQLGSDEVGKSRALLDLPALDVGGALQGRTLTVRVTAGQELQVSGSLEGAALNFVNESPTAAVALQGVHALADPGLRALDLSVRLGAEPSTEVQFSQPIRIFAIDYGREQLRVPAGTLDPEVTQPEDQMILEVVSQVGPERWWEGPFSFPGSYFESFPSFFGTRRSYNGSAFVYYHTGLDLFGSTTTPVLAPAPGRVALTDSLTVRGNSTYIDHGWGVYSGFLHQSQILVQEGDLVETGQVIGYVGATGRVTGPHLHWEIWVGRVPVDPLEWTATSFP